MALYHPIGETVEIVGLESSDRGRSCEQHDCCGLEVIKEDVVVRFRRVQVSYDGKEEAAIAAIWVTDGIDQCRVGFLGKHLVKHHHLYEGRLGQVTELYKNSESPAKRSKHHRNRGVALAAIIDTPCSFSCYHRNSNS